MILRSQWLRWPHKLEDETWLNSTTIRFIQFMKAVQHSYFKTAPDSSFVETSTRIVSVLEKEKVYLTVANAVRQLESLLSRFETAAVLDTDMSTMSTADLEQTKEAFKRNVLPTSERMGSRKLIIDILGKVPEAIGKGGVIEAGTKLGDWMDSMTLEAYTIGENHRSVDKYTDMEDAQQKAPVKNTTLEGDQTKEKEA